MSAASTPLSSPRAALAASFDQPAGPAIESLGLVLGFLRLPALAARGLAQALVQIGMMRFQVFDDLEVFFFHPAQVDLLQLNQPQPLPDVFRHAAAALVARPAALSY